MARDLLSYHTEVLEKISTADARTFRKELRKAFHRLVPTDREKLKQWFRNSAPAALSTTDHDAAGADGRHRQLK